jgi:hypothetical protein
LGFYKQIWEKIFPIKALGKHKNKGKLPNLQNLKIGEKLCRRVLSPRGKVQEEKSESISPRGKSPRVKV